MYRVLLKSMQRGAPDDKGIATHDGAAVKARDEKQNKNRTCWQPIRLAHPAQSIRFLQALVLPLYLAAFWPVVLAILAVYVGIGVVSRNNADGHPFVIRIGTVP